MKKNIPIKSTFLIVLCLGLLSITFSKSHKWNPNSEDAKITQAKGPKIKKKRSAKSKVKVAAGKKEFALTEEFMHFYIDANSKKEFTEELVVTEMQSENEWHRAGLLFKVNRDDENSAFCILAITRAEGVVFNCNGDIKSGQTKNLKKSGEVTLPVTLKLERKKKELKAFYKDAKSQKWKEIGKAKITKSISTNPGVAIMLFEPNRIKG